MPSPAVMQSRACPMPAQLSAELERLKGSAHFVMYACHLPHSPTAFGEVIVAALCTVSQLRERDFASLALLGSAAVRVSELCLNRADIPLEQLVLRSIESGDTARYACDELGLPSCCRLPLLE